jgi:hypothetical protein
MKEAAEELDAAYRQARRAWVGSGAADEIDTPMRRARRRRSSVRAIGRMCLRLLARQCGTERL